MTKQIKKLFTFQDPNLDRQIQEIVQGLNELKLAIDAQLLPIDGKSYAIKDGEWVALP